MTPGSDPLIDRLVTVSEGIESTIKRISKFDRKNAPMPMHDGLLALSLLHEEVGLEAQRNGALVNMVFTTILRLDVANNAMVDLLIKKGVFTLEEWKSAWEAAQKKVSEQIKAQQQQQGQTMEAKPEVKCEAEVAKGGAVTLSPRGIEAPPMTSPKDQVCGAESVTAGVTDSKIVQFPKQ
jgi:hypothetical protein